MSKVFFIFTFICIVYSCLCFNIEINPREFLLALSKEYNGNELDLPQYCLNETILDDLNTIHENLLNSNSFAVILTLMKISQAYSEYCPSTEINTLLTNVYNSCKFNSLPKYNDLNLIALPIIEEYYKEVHTSKSLGQILGNAAKILDLY